MKHHGLRLRILGVVIGLACMFLSGVAAGASGPGVVGDWQGSLDTGGGSLRVVIHVLQGKDGKLTASLDSPDQNASGIEVSSITYKEPDVHFEVERIGGSYDGKMNKDSSEIAGNWSQGGASLPLVFKRAAK